eukprot:CAMPEP_0201578150 /NCGR_PEP_ID=MMETSP0190_2-20130828/24891_1 /ASSEMBLY_ACC=CAM_ASM_000263 /TAXON_ID=37353 /ORGANISM="Rosalina sp." /LENGTH=66 /DNA_ID=CAMNT_0048011013 /DNA_START=1376 /DNA_END=1576 /DNA_ORIENTATION=+
MDIKMVISMDHMKDMQDHTVLMDHTINDLVQDQVPHQLMDKDIMEDILMMVNTMDIMVILKGIKKM